MNKTRAYDYYKNFIYNNERSQILEEYNFQINGTVHSIEWEIFCAILMDKKKKDQGADLEGYEVKSAKSGNSFEYQYHKKSGLRKIKEDKSVSHLFVSYSNKYKDVVIREMSPSAASLYFDSWESQIEKNYQESRQRFRRSLPYNFVIQNSKVLLRIKNKFLVDTD